MPRSRPVILVTGFGPFPGQPRNASSRLAEELAAVGRSRFPGWVLHAATLPTEWQAGPRMLAQLVGEHEPAVAVHFGVSRRSRGFTVETRAHNLISSTCDAAGETPDPGCISHEGPLELPCTFPAGLIVERLRRLGLPAQVSRDAGNYLCNAVLYHSLEDGRRRGRSSGTPRRGFVHIPDGLVGGSRAGFRRARPSALAWDDAVRGGLAIIATCVGALEA